MGIGIFYKVLKVRLIYTKFKICSIKLALQKDLC